MNPAAPVARPIRLPSLAIGSWEADASSVASFRPILDEPMATTASSLDSVSRSPEVTVTWRLLLAASPAN